MVGWKGGFCGPRAPEDGVAIEDDAADSLTSTVGVFDFGFSILVEEKTAYRLASAFTPDFVGYWLY